MTSIKLSERLQTIADLCEAGILIDVGTDHAYLPCYLVQEGKCPRAYASDLREGPLERAKAHIAEYGLEGKVIPLLGAGLQKAPKDAEIVVISGMGYDNVKEILEAADITRYRQFVIQINRHTEFLRQYLSDHRYTITKERLVREDGRDYEIVSFTPDEGRPLSEEEILFGPCLLQDKSPEVGQYFRDLWEKEKKIAAVSGKGSSRRRADLLEKIIKERE
ncbi:MAG: SAM-dependent methyltransferase [Erysipelotrichaceae bacterium]|nr:SAM-dependent methyltransferase [Erysipelotrichaceae bacterium]